MSRGASVYNLRVRRVKKKKISESIRGVVHICRKFTLFFPLIIFRQAVSEFVIRCACAKSIDQKKKKGT